VTRDDWLNAIHHGDVFDTLATLPDSSIHGWVTSPPYWDQRDYDDPGQLGRESTPEAYIEHMVAVADELRQVARSDALGWLVVDDTIRGGEMLGIPGRLATALRNDGWKVINRIPWAKPNPKPEPVENRLSHGHETVLCLAPSNDYWFDKEAVETQWDVFEVPVRPTEYDHDATFPPELPERCIKLGVPPRVCADCGTPYERTFEETSVWDLDPDRPQAQRAIEKAERAGLSDEHLEAARAVGFGDSGQGKRTQSGTGNNRDEIEQLAAEAKQVLGGYFREFTQVRKRPAGYEQTCECATDETNAGIVLEPFAGTGTTCRVAKDLGRRFAGIELNPEYVAMAQKRVGLTVDEPERLLDDGETALTAFSGGNEA
jgi:DNA modification methylase